MMPRLERADAQPGGGPEADEMDEKQAEVHEQDEYVEGADNLVGIGDRDAWRLRNGVLPMSSATLSPTPT